MKSKNPLVSVVIPCYNHEQFVQDSIQSVIDQTYKNIELIIIDDGSKDSSVEKIQEMLESCKQRFVRFEFRSRANIGLSATFNEGLEWCNGEYFTANASDDILLPKKTEIQVKFLEENRKIPAVSGGVKQIDENSKEISKVIKNNRFYKFKEIIMHEHYLPAPAQMMRMNVVKDIGGYDSNLFIEDWYMWLKLSMHGDIYYMNDVLCFYRSHNNNTSKNLVNMQQGRLAVLNCFRESSYYEEALKNIYWVNMVDAYMTNKENRYILKLFMMNPKKTALAIFKNLTNITKK